MNRYPGMFTGATGKDVEAARELPEFPPVVPSTSTAGQVAGGRVPLGSPPLPGTGSLGNFGGGLSGGESSSSLQTGGVSPPRATVGPSTTTSARKIRLRKMIQKANRKKQRSNVRPERIESARRSGSLARSPPASGGGSPAVVEKLDKATQTEPVGGEGQGQEAPGRQRAPGNLPRGHPARDLAGSANGANVAGVIRQARSRSPQRRGPSVKFLQYFLAFLYYIGMSPVKPASAMKLPRIFHWIQAAFFWFGSLMAILDAFTEVKDGWLTFCVKEDKETFVFFAFFLANFLTRLYYISLIAKSATSISQLLEKIKNVSPKKTSSSKAWPLAIGTGVGIFSVLLAGAFTFFGATPLDDWSLEKTVYLKSYKYSVHIFLWSSDAKVYENATDQLWDTYASEMTPATQALAVIGNVIGYFGTLHSCILLDLFLIVSIQISALERQLSKNMKATSSQNVPGVCPLSENWVEYKRLRDVCDESDDVFGNLLELVHTQNLLNVCYFLLQLLEKGKWNIYPFIDLMSVIKIGITYYLAQETAETNKKLENCVVERAGGAAFILIGGEEHFVMLLLDTMRQHPIGVGRGKFLINKGFVRKFAGFVASVFMLLAGNLIDK